MHWGPTERFACTLPQQAHLLASRDWRCNTKRCTIRYTAWCMNKYHKTDRYAARSHQQTLSHILMDGSLQQQTLFIKSVRRIVIMNEHKFTHHTSCMRHTASRNQKPKIDVLHITWRIIFSQVKVRDAATVRVSQKSICEILLQQQYLTNQHAACHINLHKRWDQYAASCVHQHNNTNHFAAYCIGQHRDANQYEACYINQHRVKSQDAACYISHRGRKISSQRVALISIMSQIKKLHLRHQTQRYESMCSALHQQTHLLVSKCSALHQMTIWSKTSFFVLITSTNTFFPCWYDAHYIRKEKLDSKYAHLRYIRT